MWYDATSAAGSLEAPDSPVKGKMAYAQAPVKLTEASGWLYAWSWAIEKKSAKQDNAWKFISWASSKKYEELVGAQDGWATVPAGKRISTYENPEYKKEAGRSPRRPSRRSRPPTRSTLASSRGQRSVSSLSTSRSSPTSVPRSARTSRL